MRALGRVLATRAGRRGLAAVCVAVAGISPVHAQQPPPAVEPVANLVTISAVGQLEVPQDWMSITLTISRDGADAGGVQSQLRQAVDAAMSAVKPQVVAQQLEVRSGSFGVYPRHGSNGRISGWQGTAELVLEGRDFPRISGAASRATTMGIGQIAFSLSKETQARLESEAQALAIERFKGRASEVAKGFGFAGYSLREVTVSSAEQGERPVFARAMAASPKVGVASDVPAVPVEPGKSQVVVTVSGSIQLR